MNPRNSAIRRKLKTDFTWRHSAVNPKRIDEVDGPEVIAEADAYARALNRVLDRCAEFDQTADTYPGIWDYAAETIRIAIYNELFPGRETGRETGAR